MTLAAIAIALPFAAAVIGLLLGRVIPGGPGPVAVFPTAAATVLSGIMAVDHWQHPGLRAGWFARIPTGGIPINVALGVDGLAAVVGFMVCCVALAVQVYSVAYMRGDPRYSSYAALVSLFTAAMLLVVYSADLILLYVGWEVMGICSYFLIGHPWAERASSRAAVKAFLVTRLGDAGFLVGILIIGSIRNTFAIPGAAPIQSYLPHPHGGSQVSWFGYAPLPSTRSSAYMSHLDIVFTGPARGGALVLALLLLLLGVAGKSAQFPLHSWLPDAMVGPTPISALIHAATMVAAGIYVVARLFPLFRVEPTALAVLGIIAAISMLGAALAALAQDDLKRVLAYSTISQLGYMAGGLAAGSRDGAVFHLLSHAAFKALLFLGAGCVIAATGTNLMSGMGRLWRQMPWTFGAMTIGFAALAGIPPASGFFTKDTVVAAARSATGGPAGLPHWAAWILYAAMLLTALVTAAYSMRSWLRTFFGEARGPKEVAEAPPLTRWPVVALAVPALLLGFTGLGSAALRPPIAPVIITLAFTAVGAIGAYLVWNTDPAKDPIRLLGPTRPVLAAGFYFDNLQTAVVVRPVLALARIVARGDPLIVDGAVDGVGRTARRAAGLLRRPAGGNPQLYLTGLLAGVVVIIALVAVLT